MGTRCQRFCPYQIALKLFKPNTAPTSIATLATSPWCLNNPKARGYLCAAIGVESELGHVWTAPWQELSDVSAALVGCGHVSGLLMRQVWPLALMLCADRVPNKLAHFGRSALTQAGSPDPRNDRICITSSCPRQLVLPIYLLACLMPPATVSAPYISRRGP